MADASRMMRIYHGRKAQQRMWKEQEFKCLNLQYKHKTEREEEGSETINTQIQPPGIYFIQQAYTT